MICAIGDIHLGALDIHIPDAYKLVLSTVDRAITNSGDKGCTNVVLLGDVFDTPAVDESMLIALMNLMRKHSDKHFYIIVGNHDKANIKRHSLRILQWMGKKKMLNVTVYTKPAVVKIDGRKYFMCPHPYVVDAPKGVHYAFGHFGFSGAKSDTGYVLKKGHAPSGRWILGDYHTPQHGKGYGYAGSICQVKWYEDPHKGYVEIDDEAVFIPWKPDIVLGKTEINTAEDLEKLDKDTFWEVRIAAGVKLPVDWQRSYPRIIRHSMDKIPTARAKVLMKRAASQNPLSGLADYLRSKHGLSDKDIRFGCKRLGISLDD